MNEEADDSIRLGDELTFPDCATRREIGTGLAKTAIYRCTQRGSDNFLTNMSVMLYGMMAICTEMVVQLITTGQREQAMAVQQKIHMWAAEAREIESVIQSIESESRIITPDEPRLIGLDGEVAHGVP